MQLRRVFPQNVDARPAIVYWLHDDTCQRPGWDGYVGVAFQHRLAGRLNEHRRSERFKHVLFRATILLEDHVDTCYLYEFVLRPTAGIGWNVAPGGARGNRLGIPCSQVTRKKIAAANSGRKRPDLSQRNSSANRKRFLNVVVCPHCSRSGRGPTMLRYHFKNCKFAPSREPS